MSFKEKFPQKNRSINTLLLYSKATQLGTRKSAKIFVVVFPTYMKQKVQITIKIQFGSHRNVRNVSALEPETLEVEEVGPFLVASDKQLVQRGVVQVGHETSKEKQR